jgi:hypothetical protein
MKRALILVLQMLLAHPLDFAVLATALYSGVSEIQWA